MKRELTRLALMQITLIFYSILIAGVMLKVRYGSAVPPDLFATHVRDYGYLLLPFSGAWCVWALIKTGGPVEDYETGNGGLASGLVLAGIMALMALLATVSVFTRHSLLVVEPRQPATPAPGIVNRQMPGDP